MNSKLVSNKDNVSYPDWKNVNKDNLNNWIYETQVEQWLNMLECVITDRSHLSYVALSKFVKWKTVSKNMHKPWNWRYISRNPNITWDIIINNLEYPPRPDNFSYAMNQRDSLPNDYCNNHYPDWPTGKIPWDWDAIFRNPNITWENILDAKCRGIKIIWWCVSLNPNITWDIIINNLEYPPKPDNFKLKTYPGWVNVNDFNLGEWPVGIVPWNWSSISRNPNITFDIIINNMCYPDLKNVNDLGEWPVGRIPWDWNNISYNPNITWDIVNNNLEYPPRPDCTSNQNNFSYPGNSNVENWPTGKIPWKWEYLVDCISNHGIKLDMINSYPYKNIWSSISTHPDLTWEFIKDNIDKSWDWYRISKHKCITWEVIRDNLEYQVNTKGVINKVAIPWNWYYISQNPNITWDIIMSNPSYKSKTIPWDWNGISQNPNITWEIVQNYYYKPWVLDTLTQHKCITFDIIKTKLKRRWKWCYLNYNPNITWDDIMNTKDRNWTWYLVVHREDIIWNDVMKDDKLKSKFNTPAFTSNNFTRQLELIRQDCIIKWNAAKRIRKWWLFKVYFNPFTRVGAKRLERSYQEMLEEEHS